MGIPKPKSGGAPFGWNFQIQDPRIARKIIDAEIRNAIIIRDLGFGVSRFQENKLNVLDSGFVLCSTSGFFRLFNMHFPYIWNVDFPRPGILFQLSWIWDSPIQDSIIFCGYPPILDLEIQESWTLICFPGRRLPEIQISRIHLGFDYLNRLRF